MSKQSNTSVRTLLNVASQIAASLSVKIIFVAFSLLAGAVFHTSAAGAVTGVNEQLNYQARLLTGTGAVVPDGTYNLEFKIYQDGAGCEPSGTPPCGGTLKWTETRTGSNKVTVRNGYFSVQLGAVTPFGSSVDWNQDTLWLSINVGGTGTPTWDGQMTPFRRLAASPYALNSKQLGGLDWSKFVQIAPAAAQVDSSTLSSLFINKTNSTGNILQMQKSGGNVFTIAAADGAVAFKNSNDTTEAFAILNVANDLLFSVNSEDKFVKIGVPDSDSTLLQLDIKDTSGDPANGSIGSMYYNSNANKFRCYQNTGWTDCIGAGGGGGGTLQQAYDTTSGNTITTTDGRDIDFNLAETISDSNFLIDLQCDTSCATGGRFAVQDDGVDVLKIAPAGGAATLQNTADSTAAFRVLNATAVPLFVIDTTNSRAYVGNPTADAVGALLVLDTKNTAGDPTGVAGGMYYNSSSATFRCHNTTWNDCAPHRKKKTADQTSSSTTNANVTDLSYSVAANTDYNFSCHIIFNTSITTTGIGLAFTIPASPTLISYTGEIPAAADGVNGNLQGWGTASDDTVVGTGVQTANTNYIGRIWGTLRNGANAGTLQLRFRSEVAATNAIIKAGSNCEMWQI